MKRLLILIASSSPVALGGVLAATMTATDQRSGQRHRRRPDRRPPDQDGHARLGYFPNITHAQPLVGLQQRDLRRRRSATNVTLEAKTFNAGPEVIEALFAGEVDAASSARTRRSTATCSRTARRCASSPARRAAARCSSSIRKPASTSRRTSPARRSRRRSSATRRTWRCART